MLGTSSLNTLFLFCTSGLQWVFYEQELISDDVFTVQLGNEIFKKNNVVSFSLREIVFYSVLPSFIELKLFYFMK